MKKNITLGLSLVATVVLSGCSSNPSVSSVDYAEISKKDSIILYSQASPEGSKKNIDTEILSINGNKVEESDFYYLKAGIDHHVKFRTESPTTSDWVNVTTTLTKLHRPGSCLELKLVNQGRKHVGGWRNITITKEDLCKAAFKSDNIVK